MFGVNLSFVRTSERFSKLIENIAQSQGYAGEVSNPLVSEVEQISELTQAGHPSGWPATSLPRHALMAMPSTAP